jgi:hypothetical protein
MASRALWLLEGNDPGRQQPPLDMDLNRLTNFTGNDGASWFRSRTSRWFGRRTRFARRPRRRHLRRTRTRQTFAWRKPRRAKAHLEGSRAEKKANARLREAVLRVRNAVESWSAAAENRSDDWARTPGELLTGEHQAILEALLIAQEAAEDALALMDAFMRQVPPDAVTSSFRSTLGRVERTDPVPAWARPACTSARRSFEVQARRTTVPVGPVVRAGSRSGRLAACLTSASWWSRSKSCGT